MSTTQNTPKESPNQLDIIDRANVSPAAAKRFDAGSFPPLPVIENLQWMPPNQSPPVVQSTTDEHLMIYANADHHNWQQSVPDVPKANVGPLLKYWDGYSEAVYTLTMRSYWMLVPGTYTRVTPGGGFHKQYSTTYGIATTDSQTISAELGVGVDGLSAKITAEFSHSVTTSSQTQETTTYDVGPPADGFTRVWMLWQLIDEIAALDSNGAVIANPTKRGDVNWAEHAPSGAYLYYQNLDQLFPSTFLVPVQQDFPSQP